MTKPKRPFVVKTYVVMERLNVLDENGDNARVAEVYLTSAAAERHVDRVPGTFVVPRRATK